MTGLIQQRVMLTYMGSDAGATRELYGELAERGPMGELAVNLMRACKKSERAKVYRGSRFRGASYDGKQWAMGEVCRVLTEHPELVSRWGWAEDSAQEFHNQVLYVDLPTGQVSFHTAARGAGPDYPGEWDRQQHQSARRVCAFAARVLSGQPSDQAQDETRAEPQGA